MTNALKDILKMTTEEKIDAVETIWNSIEENSLPVTQDELTIARERYAEYVKNPNDVIAWDEVKTALLKKYDL